MDLDEVRATLEARRDDTQARVATLAKRPERGASQGFGKRIGDGTIEAVSRIHFRGGSHLGIARANPTTSPALLEQTVNSLLRLNVTQLITIGGDDTAFSAMRLERHAGGTIRVVHVPKTIDNDLDLPAHIDTFGYQTARHYGVEIVKNLMVDA